MPTKNGNRLLVGTLISVLTLFGGAVAYASSWASSVKKEIRETIRAESAGMYYPRTEGEKLRSAIDVLLERTRCLPESLAYTNREVKKLNDRLIVLETLIRKVRNED